MNELAQVGSTGAEWAVYRVPVSPETCTVNGYNTKKGKADWEGLDLDKAQVRVQSSLWLMVLGARDAPLDIHLLTPFCHPEDRAEGHDADCFYRVRPKAEPGKKWKGKKVKSVSFERWDEGWYVAIEATVPKDHQP